MPTGIQVYYLPKEMYDKEFGKNILGYSMYDLDPCRIFMRTIKEYKTNDCMYEVLNHEIKHCFEGPFHSDKPSHSTYCE